MRALSQAVQALIILGAVPLIPAQAPDPVVVRDSAPLPSPSDLKIPPLRRIEVPKPSVFVLPNGLKIFLLEDHDLPVVRGTLLVRTGSLFDPKDKRGLATLTGEALRAGGTAKRTGDQIDEELESIAASVETSIEESSGTVHFHCLKENLDEVLGVVRDLVISPAFRQDKIELAKTQLRSGISRRNDDAGGIASRELFRLVYGPDTPYGAMEEYSTIDAIARADIQLFYKRYFFPANIVMGVYGDFSSAEMEQKLNRLFGSWSAVQDKVPPFPRVEAHPRPGVFFVDKPDVEQTFLEMGELGGEYRDKDFAALSVAADVFGGGFSSRLLREVRSRLGYAYEVDADWEADFDHPGIFRIACSTKSEQTVKTTQAILDQLEKLRTDEITDDELKTAKDAALNTIVFAFERPSETLARVMTYEYFGYPEDFLTRYQNAIATVTKADVLRVANEYFQPSKMTIVAVGNMQALPEPLSVLKMPVKRLDVSIPPAKTGPPTNPVALR